MPHSSDGTDRSDRLARGAAAILLIAAAISLTAAWQLHSRAESDRAVTHGDRSAVELVPPPQPAVSAAVDRSLTPTHIYVDAIGVDTSVDAKPTQRTRDPFVGRTVASFGVPDDLTTTTWWSSGSKPGSGAMAVVLGHTQPGGDGVFNDLGKLRPGDRVVLTGAGAALRFTVTVVRTGISKTDPYALRHALEAHPDDAALALITCSGTFNEDYDQSAENTVVFATLS